MLMRSNVFREFVVAVLFILKRWRENESKEGRRDGGREGVMFLGYIFLQQKKIQRLKPKIKNENNVYAKKETNILTFHLGYFLVTNLK
jgi:hypothetical protein